MWLFVVLPIAAEGELDVAAGSRSVGVGVVQAAGVRCLRLVVAFAARRIRAAANAAKAQRRRTAVRRVFPLVHVEA